MNPSAAAGRPTRGTRFCVLGFFGYCTCTGLLVYNLFPSPRCTGSLTVICPFCNANNDRVIDSRASESGAAVRRRRLCNHCNKRFTTYERVERIVRLMVVKRDGCREPFEPRNILGGIEAACGKRPISAEIKQQLVDDIEDELYHDYEREVLSSDIGQRVAERLRQVDQIAYVRYASVYKQFEVIDELIEEAQQAKERAAEEIPGQGDLFLQPESDDSDHVENH